jgi:hypothetical protein
VEHPGHALHEGPVANVAKKLFRAAFLSAISYEARITDHHFKSSRSFIIVLTAAHYSPQTPDFFRCTSLWSCRADG